MIRTLQNNEVGGFVVPDQRGKKEPPQKIDIETRNKVVEHLNCFPKVPSHYTRKDTTLNYIHDK